MSHRFDVHLDRFSTMQVILTTSTGSCDCSDLTTEEEIYDLIVYLVTLLPDVEEPSIWWRIVSGLQVRMFVPEFILNIDTTIRDKTQSSVRSSRLSSSISGAHHGGNSCREWDLHYTTGALR